MAAAEMLTTPASVVVSRMDISVALILGPVQYEKEAN
jgi:hypothetical protein